MRLLVALIAALTFITTGAFSVFALERVETRFLQNPTPHYGVSPHHRLLSTELVANPRRLQHMRSQFQDWLPRLTNVTIGATGAPITTMTDFQGRDWGGHLLQAVSGDYAYLNDIIWDMQGYRPGSGTEWRNYMVAHPTQPNQALRLFNAGWQGEPQGHRVSIVTSAEGMDNFRRFFRLNEEVPQYGMAHPYWREFQELQEWLRVNAEPTVVHTFRFMPQNFEDWTNEEAIPILRETADLANLQLKQNILSAAAAFEAGISPAAAHVPRNLAANYGGNMAMRNIQAIFSETGGTNHAGFLAQSAFAAELGRSSLLHIQGNFNSPFTGGLRGTNPISHLQEFRWIWSQLNNLGLCAETQRRVMFIIFVLQILEINAYQSQQLAMNSLFAIGEGATVFMVPTSDEERRRIPGNYDHWLTFFQSRLNSNFLNSHSPAARLATFIVRDNASFLSHVRSLEGAFRSSLGSANPSMQTLLPLSFVEISLDTVFVLYHLVMGDNGNFTVNGNRMQHMQRNHGVDVPSTESEHRFFTLANQHNLESRTRSFQGSIYSATERRIRFGVRTVAADSLPMLPLLWFNLPLGTYGNNQRLSTTRGDFENHQTIADMFSNTIPGLNPNVTTIIHDIILNEQYFQYFQPTGCPVDAWVDYNREVASKFWPSMRLSVTTGNRGGSIVFTYPIFASQDILATALLVAYNTLVDLNPGGLFNYGVFAHLAFWGHDTDYTQRNVFTGYAGRSITNREEVATLSRFNGSSPIYISGYSILGNLPGSQSFSLRIWSEVLSSSANPTHANHLPMWRAMHNNQRPINDPRNWTPTWWDSLGGDMQARQRQHGFNYDLLLVDEEEEDLFVPQPTPSPPPDDLIPVPFGVVLP